MLGKPEWFARRKYGGWGLVPVTWQGWVYIGIFLIPLIGVSASGVDPTLQTNLTLIWVACLVLDVVDIMVRLKKDEREIQHEALAERNAAWAMVTIIGVAVIAQTYTSVSNKTVEVDPWLLGVLAAGVIVKAATNFYLRDK